MVTVIAASIEIGTFELNSDIRTVDALLKKLAVGTPAAFASRGMFGASFQRETGSQWGRLFFEHNAFPWLLGVQFYLAAGSEEVVAKIRYGGGADDIGERDPQELTPALENIYQAMLRAVEI